jgi:hypothetical protein
MLWGLMELAAETKDNAMLLHELIKVTPAASRQQQIKMSHLQKERSSALTVSQHVTMAPCVCFPQAQTVLDSA